MKLVAMDSCLIRPKLLLAPFTTIALIIGKQTVTKDLLKMILLHPLDVLIRYLT